MSDSSSDHAENPMEQPNDSDKTSPPNLSDMPLDVVGLIIERSDYKEQLVLRKVSKSLRKLVDQQKRSCTRLHLYFQPDMIKASFNQNAVYYVPPTCPNIELLMAKKAEKEGKINLIVSDDYEKIAFDDLTYTLKYPKLQLHNFSVSFYEVDSYGYRDNIRDKYGKFRNILESINHQISTRKCEIDIECPSKYCSILPFLKPGVLETIKVSYYPGVAGKGTALESLKRIAELDQWKQAEKLVLSGFYRFPIQYATHFKRFHFNEPSVNYRFLDYLTRRLLALKSFEYCKITAGFESNTRDLHALIGQPAPPNDRTEFVSHLILDSEYYLEFMFFHEKGRITIEKKKRSDNGF